jgi:hypothetical protein
MKKISLIIGLSAIALLAGLNLHYSHNYYGIVENSNLSIHVLAQDSTSNGGDTTSDDGGTTSNDDSTTDNGDGTTGNGDGTTGNGDGTSNEGSPQTGWTEETQSTNYKIDGVLYKQSEIVKCYEGGSSAACSESCKYRIIQNNDWSDWHNC